MLLTAADQNDLFPFTPARRAQIVTPSTLVQEVSQVCASALVADREMIERVIATSRSWYGNFTVVRGDEF